MLRCMNKDPNFKEYVTLEGDRRIKILPKDKYSICIKYIQCIEEKEILRTKESRKVYTAYMI